MTNSSKAACKTDWSAVRLKKMCIGGIWKQFFKGRLKNLLFMMKPLGKFG
ncbi:hypothetical protein l11_10040 [Neisseria weaveri LMG 5135]|nr:hypothetical protein l13_15070 [Neisseria weaveri ATCC 51223]EGV37763.1 hypothetical protein l11_10040 [Neisseria weaveri LMG 5135]